MIKIFAAPRTLRRRLGLSLVELAIVLGVIGLVGAAIWATASRVKSRQTVQDSVQIVTEIASNVRGVYTGFSDPTERPLTVAAQIAANLFPMSVVNAAGTNTLNVWGGTISIKFPIVGAFNGFSIEFTLPASVSDVDRREACVSMISRLPGKATNYGGGFAGTLPTGVVALDMAQGGGPSLVYIRDSVVGWKNVTGDDVATLFPGAEDCDGFAFYFKM